jgi:hypothetical protein
LVPEGAHWDKRFSKPPNDASADGRSFGDDAESALTTNWKLTDENFGELTIENGGILLEGIV